MIHLLAGSTLEGPFLILSALFHGSAYGVLTLAGLLGALSLRAAGEPDAKFQRLMLHGVRGGFLLLTLGQITQSIGTTLARGEFWIWEPEKNLGLLIWLVYAAVLHMQHVPALKGRKATLASLVAWSFLALALLGANLSGDREMLFSSRGAPVASHGSHPAGHPGP